MDFAKGFVFKLWLGHRVAVLDSSEDTETHTVDLPRHFYVRSVLQDSFRGAERSCEKAYQSLLPSIQYTANVLAFRSRPAVYTAHPCFLVNP